MMTCERYRCEHRGVEILSSRILVRPLDLDRTRRFYRDVLGLAVYREFGPPDHPSVVFFLGQGLLEVSGHAPAPPGGSVMLWLQVRDVRAARRQLAAAGVRVVREPVTEPWGLIEMWIEDPDGIPIVMVEVPADHPLRRDTRLRRVRYACGLTQRGPRRTGRSFTSASAVSHKASCGVITERGIPRR